MAVNGERWSLLPDGVVIASLPAGVNNAMLASKTLTLVCVRVCVFVLCIFLSCPVGESITIIKILDA